MRNKHLLLVFVAMLGLAFVYPTSLSAQKDKKKKEKKELIWELPEPSGDPTIDGYLLSCDTFIRFQLIETAFLTINIRRLLSP